MTTKNIKALLVVGSRHGSTYAIANYLSASLNKEGLNTVVAYPEDITSLDAYDVVFVGSAVYRGKWLKQMREFVDDFADEIQTKKCYLFSSGQVGKHPMPEYDSAVHVDDILEKTGAAEHALFTGELDKSKLGLAERVVAKVSKVPEGDYRNWDEIDFWAKQCASKIMSES
jgi:menaquinone-dependent protoporphyrinogen oxidase